MAVDTVRVEDNVKVEIDAATSVAVVTIDRPQRAFLEKRKPVFKGQ